MDMALPEISVLRLIGVLDDSLLLAFTGMFLIHLLIYF